MRAEGEAPGGSQVAQPTPFLNVPLPSHVRSFLGLRGGLWLSLQTLQAPTQLCWGKTSPQPDPGPDCSSLGTRLSQPTQTFPSH